MAIAPRRISVDDFSDLLRIFRFPRKIESIHLHHTWNPSRREFRGQSTIEAMDPAHHLAIDPEGYLWTGRNWNDPPASAQGFNGNARFGPFMIELVGDFNLGHDSFDGPQRDAAVRALALLLRRCQLPLEQIRFHKQMDDRTSCPGGIDRDALLQDVAKSSSALKPARTVITPFDDSMLRAQAIAEALASSSGRAAADDTGELPEEKQRGDGSREAFGRAVDGPPDLSAPLTADDLAELSGHVINMRGGHFADDTEFHTDEGTVRHIFTHLLEDEYERRKEAKMPMRIVFFAHGGLIPESAGLRIAQKHVWWWKKNNVYPIYFVWHTGFWQTVGDLLRRHLTGARGPLDIIGNVKDHLLEEFARYAGGVDVWGGMKYDAEHAVAPGGGSLFVADRLAEFVQAHKDGGVPVEVHAAGHSAGAIFHSYFAPAAVERHVAVKSMHFLAPALRVDGFKQRLDGRLGNGIDKLTIYTMRRELEEADNCAKIYGKSLLYLIHFALEPSRREPLLGLQQSLLNDPALVNRFGLGSQKSPTGEVVWSKSKIDPRHSTQATAHGAFDDDPDTMNSVLRNILDLPNDAQLQADFVESASRGLVDEQDLREPMPPEVALLQTAAVPAPPPFPGWSPSQQAAAAAAPIVTPQPGHGRVAVCVGINDYPQQPLSGCVADARQWADALRRLGFDTTLLLDREATADKIRSTLVGLVERAQAGDVVVFQYSGHGTQVPDQNADEKDAVDEALCPYDYADGNLLVDDDIGAILDGVKAGVSFTFFLDCCHSGSATRFAVGRAVAAASNDERPRFITLTPEQKQAYLAKSRRRGLRVASRSRRVDEIPEVVFAACRPDEVAWESGGSGDFTRNTVPLLAQAAAGTTNSAFLDMITRSFGPAGRQHPVLDCAPVSLTTPLLQVRGSVAAPSRAYTPAAASGQANDGARIAAALRDLAMSIEASYPHG